MTVAPSDGTASNRRPSEDCSAAGSKRPLKKNCASMIFCQPSRASRALRSTPSLAVAEALAQRRRAIGKVSIFNFLLKKLHQSLSNGSNKSVAFSLESYAQVAARLRAIRRWRVAKGPTAN